MRLSESLLSGEKEYEEERRKPVEQRDPSKLRRLRLRLLDLAIKQSAYNAFKMKILKVIWGGDEPMPDCPGCPGSAGMPRRVAASFAAYEAYLASHDRQLREFLSAELEGRRARPVASFLFDFGSDEENVAVMRAVPAIDLCAACQLDTLEREDERCRLEGQRLLAMCRRIFCGDQQEKETKLQRAQGCMQSAGCIPQAATSTACCVERSCNASGVGVSRGPDLFLPEEDVPSIPSVHSRLALRHCAPTGARQAGGA